MSATTSSWVKDDCHDQIHTGDIVIARFRDQPHARFEILDETGRGMFNVRRPDGSVSPMRPSTILSGAEHIEPATVALDDTFSDADNLLRYKSTGELVPDDVLVDSSHTMTGLTYRERRLRKAERLQEWAEKREVKAEAAHQASHDATAGIPFGQPIIRGHYSARRHLNAVERGQRQASAALEHDRKAADFRSRAANIEAAADQAIYSDDPDAIDRLRERIAELEAERERIKRYNASCRKAAKTGGTGDVTILSDVEREELLRTAKVAPMFLRAGGAMPAYKLSNLSGNINRLRQRLAGLEA